MFKKLADILFSNLQFTKYNMLFLLTISFFSLNLMAATLTINDNLVLRDVDDKEVKSGFLSTTKTVELAPGKHTLVVKYKDVFEDLEFAEERLVKSDYFVVKFLLVKQQVVTLSTTEIKNLAAAERFAKKPELLLLDEANQEIPLILEKLSDYELAKQVTKVVTTLSTTVESVPTEAQTIKVEKNVKTFNDNVISQVDAVPMLKYWWKKANQDEKAHFLQYIHNSKK